MYPADASADLITAYDRALLFVACCMGHDYTVQEMDGTFTTATGVGKRKALGLLLRLFEAITAKHTATGVVAPDEVLSAAEDLAPKQEHSYFRAHDLLRRVQVAYWAFLRHPTERIDRGNMMLWDRTRAACPSRAPTPATYTYSASCADCEALPDLWPTSTPPTIVARLRLVPGKNARH